MQAKDTVVQEVHAIQNETEIEDESPELHPPSKVGSFKENTLESAGKRLESQESTR